jgi:peptidoglycan hydrolase-like protein with peptidoglycan-binding domain
VLCVLASAGAPAAHAKSSNANTAALQVALRALHHYTGGIDGLTGRRTKRAVRRFQRSRHLHADGVAGPRTRQALGRRGRPLLGHRLLRRGNHGWDVAAVQFMLRRRGYAVTVDGGFGAVTQRAIKQFQARRALGVDGRVGKRTLRALKHRTPRRRSGGGSSGGGGGGGSPTGPVRFLRPVSAPMGDGFGFVSGRNHTGIDFPAPMGTAVGAAGRGTVTFAGWNSGGYGNLMIVRHRLGYETWYAHLSGFSASTGATVAGGVRIASVGSTGRSTGPHLHFEVRHNGSPINPAPYLLSATSLRPFARDVEPMGMDCAAAPRIRDSAAGYEDDPRRAVLEPCGDGAH